MGRELCKKITNAFLHFMYFVIGKVSIKKHGMSANGFGEEDVECSETFKHVFGRISSCLSKHTF